jgi:hypothetical protein
MAGTIPLSMTTQFDIYGKPLSGGRLYGIQAGSVSTPQNFYQDLALSIAWPNPIILDAGGRIPQLLCADGEIKIRLEDKNGVVQLAADHVLVIGPSSGGGTGGATIDPSTVAQTGDMKFRHATGIHPGVTPGWVRLNGLTIGSVGSSASERANADCEALFKFLWADPLVALVGGAKGANAPADWAANRQLVIPDWRGYALAALDDMGNSAAGRLTNTYWGGTPTQLGSTGGSESTAMTAAQMPNHFHGTTIFDAGHSHPFTAGNFNAPFNGMQGGGTFSIQFGANANLNTTGVGTGVRLQSPANGANNTESTGGGAAMRTIGPRKLVTFYIKL